MTESGDILTTGLGAMQRVELTDSHEEEYLLTLIDRDREIKRLKSSIVELELTLRAEQARCQEKDDTIRLMRKENADLHTALELERAQKRAAARTTTAEPSIALASTDAKDDAMPTAKHYPTRRKPCRLDGDTIARLKNDRKGYPAVCDKAMHYWQMLADAGLVDERLRPTARCGVTVAARIVSRMQTEVDPAITWAFFERYWKMRHLQSNLHRESYTHQHLYAVVNRIFGLAADAPYLTKSSLTV